MGCRVIERRRPKRMLCLRASRSLAGRRFFPILGQAETDLLSLPAKRQQQFSTPYHVRISLAPLATPGRERDDVLPFHHYRLRPKHRPRLLLLPLALGLDTAVAKPPVSWVTSTPPFNHGAVDPGLVRHIIAALVFITVSWVFRHSRRGVPGKNAPISRSSPRCQARSRQLHHRQNRPLAQLPDDLGAMWGRCAAANAYTASASDHTHRVRDPRTGWAAAMTSGRPSSGRLYRRSRFHHLLPMSLRFQNAA